MIKLHSLALAALLVSSAHAQEAAQRAPEIATGYTEKAGVVAEKFICLLYTSPSPRDLSTSRMPSSA